MTNKLIEEYLEPIQIELHNSKVQDISVNNDGSLWICTQNKWSPQNKTLPSSSIYAIATLLSSSEKIKKHTLLCCDKNNLRISIALQPTARNQPILVIRKHTEQIHPLSHFSRPLEETVPLNQKTLHSSDYDITDTIKEMIVQKKNILISGETSSGKTSFLSSLTSFFQTNERVIFIEDASEIISHVKNCLFFKSDKDIHCSELIHFSLRCRPDRIVLGEIRGEEACSFIESCNTGHRGSLTTLHANSAEDTLHRLEILLSCSQKMKNWPHSMIKKMIYTNIDCIIHMRRGKNSPCISELIKIQKTKGEYKIISMTP